MTTLNCKKCNIIQEDHGQKVCLDCGGGPLEFYEQERSVVQHLSLVPTGQERRHDATRKRQDYEG
jgi:hypothetical protein